MLTSPDSQHNHTALPRCPPPLPCRRCRSLLFLAPGFPARGRSQEWPATDLLEEAALAGLSSGRVLCYFCRVNHPFNTPDGVVSALDVVLALPISLVRSCAVQTCGLAHFPCALLVEGGHRLLSCPLPFQCWLAFQGEHY